MASLKDVRVKINGVKKTRQITRAMNMVASAKLRGAQTKIERFRPYADKFYEALSGISSTDEEIILPLMTRKADPKAIGILLVTSDRGLCGSFNANLINTALKLAKKSQAEGLSVRFYCIGKKGRDVVKRQGFEIAYEAIGQMNIFNFQLANAVCNDILNDFLTDMVDEVHIVHGEFISLARQVAKAQALLPIGSDLIKKADEKVADKKELKDAGADYSYEPSAQELLAVLLPSFFKVQVYRGLLDTSASEHAARMTAMDNATKSCDDMVSALTHLFNKTRQAAITTDLMDIVSGAEALKG